MAIKTITRRDFLKAGCLTMAATGAAICGISAALPIEDPDILEMPSHTFGEPHMEKPILVTYASGLGSTAEVATEIGKTLGSNGMTVDVMPIQEKPPLDHYQAVLIGSAVRHGEWLPEALEFVKSQQYELLEIPAAVFCVHISNLGNDATSRQNRLAYLDAVRALLDPVDEAFFAGKFDRRGAALLLPGWLARFVPTLDFRKWDQIRAWAEDMSARLIEK